MAAQGSSRFAKAAFMEADHAVNNAYLGMPSWTNAAALTSAHPKPMRPMAPGVELWVGVDVLPALLPILGRVADDERDFGALGGLPAEGSKEGRACSMAGRAWRPQGILQA